MFIIPTVPPTIETAPDDIQTKEGEDRTIECVARGDPKPSVRWERVDFTPSDTVSKAAMNNSKIMTCYVHFCTFSS